MHALELLTLAVEKNTTVTESAVTFIAGLKEQLEAATAAVADQGADVTALNELAAALNAESDKLAAAIAVNTVAADEVIEAPVVDVVVEDAPVIEAPVDAAPIVDPAPADAVA